MPFPDELLFAQTSPELAEFEGGILFDFRADVARREPRVSVKCGVFQLVAFLL
jgi:hypothetical protein